MVKSRMYLRVAVSCLIEAGQVPPIDSGYQPKEALRGCQSYYL